MKFTLSWLKEHLDTNASLEDIVEKLTAIGLEVDGVEDPAKTFEGFIVGEVLEAKQHPDADKLQCLMVNTGTEELKVVCGAPNARKGLKGVFAPAKSYVPGIDMVLKKANIRGEESNGMLCSEKELCISDEHAGIIELPADAKVGSPAADILGLNDQIIDIELTPDRGDCTGVYGIARDLAAADMGTLKPLKVEKVAGSFASPITVEIKDKGACDLFVGRYIKGVKNVPSPKWLQDKLKAVGQKPISALVDITNYFTIAFGRPLHVFDVDKLQGNIHVRFAKEGEEILALDDSTYKLNEKIPAICDDSGVIGMGGIMGGMSTGTGDDTTDVYLECAYFNSDAIRIAGQKLKIDSDARYRFERGVDPAFTHDGAELATQMILDICGGDASETVVAGEAPDITREVEFSPNRVKTLGGCDVDADRQKEILVNLGFTVDDSQQVWKITNPSWRHDIDAGEADMVEEVLRINGFDKIPAVPVTRDFTMDYPQPTPVQKNIKTMRHILANRNMNEAVTWSFMSEDKADLFGMAENPNKKAITLTNPISSDLSIMRPSALPNLIDMIGRNADKGYPDLAVFEIGRNFESTEAEGQFLVVSGARSNNVEGRHWAGEPRTVDAIDAKTDVVVALEAAGIKVENLRVAPEAPSYYHPGRSGAFKMGKNVIAYFGEIHPGVLDKMDRDEAYVAFEIFVERLPAAKKKTTNKGILKMSALQPLSRDFAFLVDKDMAVDAMLRAVKAADRKLIVDADIFDVYVGKGVDDDKKSVALSATLQPTDKTLTDKEIAVIADKIVAKVEKDTGGVLRS